MKKKIYRLSIDEKQKLLKALALQLGEKEKIAFAYAFGSFAEDTPFHDIDVGHISPYAPYSLPRAKSRTHNSN